MRIEYISVIFISSLYHNTETKFKNRAMNDTQPYSETQIEITNLTFDKAGAIYFAGSVNGEHFVISWDATMKDFHKVLPPEVLNQMIPCVYKDQDDLMAAALDDYYNLAFLLKINGTITARLVYLEQIIRDALYEAYIKTQ